MTTQAQKIADMATTIRCTQGMVDFVVGSDDVEVVAEEWVEAGFDCDEAAEWWNAGCFDCDRTVDLCNAGLEPDLVAELHGDDEPESWGYAYCNCDVSLESVCEHFGV